MKRFAIGACLSAALPPAVVVFERFLRSRLQLLARSPTADE